MFKRLWNAWKQIARRIGDFQARVLLTLIYVTLILPFGVIVRAFGDPLRIRRRPAKWNDCERHPSDLGWARRQW